MTPECLCDNLRAKADTNELDIRIVLVYILDEASEDWEPGCALDIINRGDSAWQDDSLHMGQLSFGGQMEVKNIVYAPLFDITTTTPSHVLANEHSFVQSLHMGPSIEVEHCHLWVESHGQDFRLVDVNSVDYALGHIHDQLHVEARNECAHEIGVEDLTERDPMQ